jgi:hypothetical protein
MSRELIAVPYKDKQMPRFGLTVPFLFSEKVHFSGAVGYAATSEIGLLLAGKGESASERRLFNMLPMAGARPIKY